MNWKRWMRGFGLALVALLTALPAQPSRLAAADDGRLDVIAFMDGELTNLLLPSRSFSLTFSGSACDGVLKSGVASITLPDEIEFTGSFTWLDGDIEVDTVQVSGQTATFTIDENASISSQSNFKVRIGARTASPDDLPDRAPELVFAMQMNVDTSAGGCSVTASETAYMFYSKVESSHDAGTRPVRPRQIVSVNVTTTGYPHGKAIEGWLSLPVLLGADLIEGTVTGGTYDPDRGVVVVNNGSAMNVSYQVRVREAFEIGPNTTELTLTRASLRMKVFTDFPANPTDGPDHAQTEFFRSLEYELPYDPAGGGLDVDIEAFDADGNPIDDDLTADQVLNVRLTLTNEGDETLKKFRFENDALLVIDPRSPGGAEIVSGPIPKLNKKKLKRLKLKKGKSVSFEFKIRTTAAGLAAAHCKATAQQKKGDEVEDGASLRMDIESGDVVTDELANWIAVQVIRAYLLEKFQEYYAALEARGARLREQLLKVLSPEAAAAWFSNPDGFSIDDWDWAQALLSGSSPQMVDARLPDGPIQGHTVEELNAAYNDAFKEELGDGLRKYAKRWGKLGQSAKEGAQEAYAEALLASYYFFGNATPQEQTEFVSKMVAFSENNEASFDSIVSTVKREIPRWKENGVYTVEAIKMSALDVTLQSPDLQAQLAQERKWRKNKLKQAETDPVKFQRDWAKRDAEIANLGIPLVLDTIFGGVVTRGVGAANNVVIKGSGSSVLRAGKAAGVLDETGAVVAGDEIGVAIADSGSVQGARVSNAARTSEEFLESLDDATLVRSSDAGNIYELPNVGGVPETTLDVKAGILTQLEDLVFQKTGKRVKLVEALKPSSPYRKPDGVAKLELTEQKTGKPEMLDAGMPGDGLGEANIWRNTTHPSARPGFNAMSKPRKIAAIEEWNKANSRWAEWDAPEIGSKTERLQQLIGQEGRVPLDLKPNDAGLQRFVVGEFEEVLIQEGTAEARLIRVKKYKVEVVDTNSGRTVNTRTIVDEANPVPQTPDADAVAVIKEIGTDANGKPIYERLTPAEERIVLPNYIDLNIKARVSGLLPDAAEHGVTLLLNDASAVAAGKILPRYGVPFLPEGAGTAFLRRISPFVKSGGLTDEQMFQKMLALVNEEGGFGQHLVLVSRDSRYLGEINVAAW